MKNKLTSYKFFIIQILLWITWGSFGQYYIYYLTDNGYTNSTIGIALTVFSIFGIIGQYSSGYIADKKRTIKNIYILFNILFIMFVGLFIVFVKIPPASILIIGFIGFIWLSLEPLLDSWFFSYKDIDKSDYCFVRCGGSLGYSLIALCLGPIITYWGYNFMFISFFLFALLNIFMSSKLNDGTFLKNNVEKIDLKKLFSIPAYVQLLVFSVFIFTTTTMINSYYPMIIRNVGGNTTHLGLTIAISTILEIPLFLCSSRFILKFKANVIFLICSILLILRVITLSLATSPIGVLGTVIFHASAFTLSFSTIKIYISKITPKDMQASAQTVAASFIFGITGILSSLIGGFVLDISMSAFYIALNILSFLTFIYSIFYILIGSKNCNLL
ncbi:MFS transporter [Clostridium sediminicola]|uniref:MFS transporter n=1 Tax=Clostridium sediminicola TaxID=3114879 RepID=UPI003D1792EA